MIELTPAVFVIGYFAIGIVLSNIMKIVVQQEKWTTDDAMPIILIWPLFLVVISLAALVRAIAFLGGASFPSEPPPKDTSDRDRYIDY